MTSYSVYIGDEDKGFIIADSLAEAEYRAYELHHGSDREDVTVSFLEVDLPEWARP